MIDRAYAPVAQRRVHTSKQKVVPMRCFLSVLAALAAITPLADSGSALVTNGSFEEPKVTDSIFFESIPGWTKIGRSDFELDNDSVMTGGAGSFRSSQGDQHIE